jgi:hypothetical protein
MTTDIMRCEVTYHIPGLRRGDPSELCGPEPWVQHDPPGGRCRCCHATGTTWVSDAGDCLRRLCTSCGVLETLVYDDPVYRPAKGLWREILKQLPQPRMAT